jgi:hypothetical protein
MFDRLNDADGAVAVKIPVGKEVILQQVVRKRWTGKKSERGKASVQAGYRGVFSGRVGLIITHVLIL